MPRVTLDPAERDINRFSDWVRGELRRQKKTQRGLATELECTPGLISQKLSGQTAWTLREYFTICRFLGGREGQE